MTAARKAIIEAACDRVTCSVEFLVTASGINKPGMHKCKRRGCTRRAVLYRYCEGHLELEAIRQRERQKKRSYYQGVRDPSQSRVVCRRCGERGHFQKTCQRG